MMYKYRLYHDVQIQALSWCTNTGFIIMYKYRLYHDVQINHNDNNTCFKQLYNLSNYTPFMLIFISIIGNILLIIWVQFTLKVKTYTGNILLIIWVQCLFHLVINLLLHSIILFFKWDSNFSCNSATFFFAVK